MNGRADHPFVFVNMAMTADGKIATANRAVSSFGSRRDLEHLYELRATADAVMAGARTIELNAARLGPGGRRFELRRLRHGLARYNLRVVVSGSGTIDCRSPIFQHRVSPIIVIASRRAPARRLQALREVSDEVLVAGDDEIDWPVAFRHLRARWRIRRLLCEGGGELNDALWRAGLVDEIHLTVCPIIFGGRSAPTIAEGRGALDLARAELWRLHSRRRLGSELFLVWRRANAPASEAPPPDRARRGGGRRPDPSE